MSNPLYKSRQKTFVGGNPLYNFGGWTPHILFPSVIGKFFVGGIKSYSPDPSVSGVFEGGFNGFVYKNTTGITPEINDISWNGNIYVACGLIDSSYAAFDYSGATWYSTDGENWTITSTQAPDSNLIRVLWDGTKFITTATCFSGNAATNKAFLYSTDGFVWTGSTSSYANLSGTSSVGLVGITELQNTISVSPGLAKYYIGINFWADNLGAIVESQDFGYTFTATTLTDFSGGTPQQKWIKVGYGGKGNVYFIGSSSGSTGIGEIYYNSLWAASFGWQRTNAYLILSGYNVFDFCDTGDEIFALCSATLGGPALGNFKIIRSDYGVNWTDYYDLGDLATFYTLRRSGDYFIVGGGLKILYGNADIGFYEIPKGDVDAFNGYILPFGDNNT